MAFVFGFYLAVMFGLAWAIRSTFSARAIVRSKIRNARTLKELEAIDVVKEYDSILFRKTFLLKPYDLSAAKEAVL